MVDTNTFVEPCNDLCGDSLLNAVDHFLDATTIRSALDQSLLGVSWSRREEFGSQ